jgi:hypothetical protein
LVTAASAESAPVGRTSMVQNVNGSRLPLPGQFWNSQSRNSPRAPIDTLPVPIPPSGNAATVAPASRGRIDA